MEEAYELAKNGGYQGRVYAPIVHSEWLDPLFWQAFGKSLGWFYPDGRSVAKYTNNDPKRTQKDLWLWHWHCFIDHLAKGKDADSFFKNLLNK